MSDNTKSAAILEVIIHLSGKRQLCTMAEGIETMHESDLIQSLGCGVGRGFLFARSVTRPNLIEHLKNMPSLAMASC